MRFSDLSILLLFVVGCYAGIFLNSLITQIPARIKRLWTDECYSFLKLAAPQNEESAENTVTRSTLQYLVPVLGHFGSHKTAQVPLRMPIVEFLSGILLALSVFKFGLTPMAVLSTGFLWTVMVLSFIDLETQLLPDDLTLPLLWLGLLVNLSNFLTDLHSAVLGAALGYLVLWSVFKLFKLISGKEGMGYGDFKLTAAIGAWLGWQPLPEILLIAGLTGAAAGLATYLKRGQNQIPFGPHLGLSASLMLLTGGGWLR